ncbi:MAG: hypothetical protein ACKO23_10640 [Gemmataceae bacterium]
MARDAAPISADRPPIQDRPWTLLVLGMILVLAGWLISRATEFPGPVPLAITFSGAALLIFAVIRQVSGETWNWPGRIESASLVSIAGLGAMAGYAAMRPPWNSGQMFFGALFILSLAGCLLILLPPLGRKIALTLFVLFHFAGMAVCVTSIDPPGNTGPFVAKQLWTWIYRPYLSFMYMTNAYHFYSPDPGAPELFWFAIQYDDGSYTWIKLPDRGNSPVAMHYQRLLALPAHTFAASSRLPLSTAEMALIPIEQRSPRGPWEEIYYRREMGSTLEFRRQEKPRRLPIPMVLDMDVSWQYREATDTSKKSLASVARRIFWTAPPPRDEEGNVKAEVRVKSVKMYRVVTQVLSPLELSQGISPLEKTKHLPFFLGEFDAYGNLVDDREPFLYWYLPIAKVPPNYPNHGMTSRPGVPAINVRSGAPGKDWFLLDCMEMHAAGRWTSREEKKP